MIQPFWLSVDQVLRLHEIQIRKYGGTPGIRDSGLLESAVLRPRNQCYYEQVDDIVDLAATYAVAISASHPFFDGNKRTAFYAMAVFLEINGQSLSAPEAEAARAMLELAAKTSTEQFRQWVKRWSV